MARIRSSPQPSTRAASGYSSGIVRKNCLSKKIENTSTRKFRRMSGRASRRGGASTTSRTANDGKPAADDISASQHDHEGRLASRAAQLRERVGRNRMLDSSTSRSVRRPKTTIPAQPPSALASRLASSGRQTELAPPYDTRSIFGAARNHDPVGREVVGEVARRIALHVAPIAAVADVELIVLGGGIAANGDLLLDPVGRVLAEWLPSRRGSRSRRWEKPPF